MPLLDLPIFFGCAAAGSAPGSRIWLWQYDASILDRMGIGHGSTLLPAFSTAWGPSYLACIRAVRCVSFITWVQCILFFLDLLLPHFFFSLFLLSGPGVAEADVGSAEGKQAHIIYLI